MCVAYVYAYARNQHIMEPLSDSLRELFRDLIPVHFLFRKHDILHLAQTTVKRLQFKNNDMPYNFFGVSSSTSQVLHSFSTTTNLSHKTQTVYGTTLVKLANPAD